MKYGIVTFHNTLNCGATLQAFALCKFLQNKGIDCDILDYRCKSIENREMNFKHSRNLLKTIVNYVLVWPKQKKKNKEFYDFLKSNNVLSEKSYTEDTICEANNHYDGFITGSDQVWNTVITNNDYNYFLRFAEDPQKRLSYAASIGQVWDSSKNDEIGALLKRYDAISVRELCDYRMLKNSVYPMIKHVCDPTMLLNREQWESIAILPNIQGDYILLYNPRNGIEKAAKDYSKKKNIPIVQIGTGREKLRKNGPIVVTPNEWIGYFIKAKAVFTDSYHGLLFSMYFHKPVWTAYKGERSSRQDTLYEKFGIADSVTYNDTDISIDYQRIDEEIYKFRNESSQFILSLVER